ncbi:MAG: hypothetical protein DWQ07_18205 [Chloroflexi bacterium]|nr:MAG: hypothetical protein DWQ07_18205 [Chloroflexota bacterium]MBL1197384.1 hypothetical protein [Chloroflexota bacterium]NOH14680.1 cytochrome C oxidase subunit IV family protein [Chloroflexota bacterium]
MSNSQQTESNAAQRIGLLVFITLIVLLTLEFIVAQITVPRWLIFVFAAIQAGIVVWEYMHLSRLFQRDKQLPPIEGSDSEPGSS